jgi:hypothetical protein
MTIQFKLRGEAFYKKYQGESWGKQEVGAHESTGESAVCRMVTKTMRQTADLKFHHCEPRSSDRHQKKF